jgi:hypothetical protein
MREETWERLVRDADATAARPTTPVAGLAGRVRRKARRRRRRMAGSVAAGAVVLVLGAASLWWPRRAGPVVGPTRVSAAEIARLRVECAQTAREAEAHERLAAAMLERERRATRRAAEVVVNPVDVVDAVAAERERSAMILLFQADRLLRDVDARAEATDALRRVLELFPNSRGAAMARERLDRIGV